MRRLVSGLAVAALLASTAGARDDRGRPRNRDRQAPPPTAEPLGSLAATRTIDGTGNHPEHEDWGAAGTPFLRVTTAAYADGTTSPGGADRPSARAISNAVCVQDGDRPSTAGITDMVWQWGQFLDHDIVETPVADPSVPFDIEVPAGDPWFDPFGTGAATIALNRSHQQIVDGIGQQVNQITAFIDASNVYGSDAKRAAALRTNDGTGRLRTGRRKLLPFNEEGLPNAPSSSPELFLAGDIRANEQVALASLHALFVREHNYWARLIDRTARSRRGRRGAGRGDRVRLTRDDLGLTDRQRLSGDAIYELARAIVGAEMQVITYREFLPVLLGPGAIEPYRGYRPDVDPRIANVFATAAYRVGHTMLSPTLLRLRRDGTSIAAGDLALADAFFAPEELIDNGGIEPLLRGLCEHPAQDVDPYVIDDVRNFLFGPPGAGGFDLASLNIQRGRDHGLPSYVQLRRNLGLPEITTMDGMTTEAEVAVRLADVYESVEQIDAWVGGLAEDAVPGALVGPTFHRILTDQFRALRDGDRFWYRNHLPDGLADLVEQQTLAGIIRRNTRIGRELPDDVWHVR
jgi:hypothetical protein